MTREDPAFLLLLVLAAHPNLELDYSKMVQLSWKIPSPHLWTSQAVIEHSICRLIDLAHKLHDLPPLTINTFNEHFLSIMFNHDALGQTEGTFETRVTTTATTAAATAATAAATAATAATAAATATVTAPVISDDYRDYRNDGLQIGPGDADSYVTLLQRLNDEDATPVDIMAIRQGEAFTTAEAVAAISIQDNDSNGDCDENEVASYVSVLSQIGDYEYLSENVYDNSNASDGCDEPETESGAAWFNERSSSTQLNYTALYLDFFSYPIPVTGYGEGYIHQEDDDEDTRSVASVGGGVWV
jgi:hypothetical protein